MQTPLEMKIGRDEGGPLSESEIVYYRELLKKNARSMLGRKLRQRLGSSDLVQETLMVTVMNLSTIIGRPRRAVFQWMISVMRHRVLKHTRADKVRQRAQGHGVRPIAIEDAGLETNLINIELKELIMNKLTSLDALSSRMFELRYFEDRQLHEIAELVGRSKDAVRGNLYRTLLKVRQELKESMS
ncbi:MAG: sigma-70 family RNA polymerase sigma factor [Planctomycetota bacterium]|nr:sigma-70 family RNA polymerase sigma factor [Planctomycetota bacterium]